MMCAYEPSFVVWSRSGGIFPIVASKENPKEARRCELARVYTKSWLQLRISELHHVDGRQGCIQGSDRRLQWVQREDLRRVEACKVRLKAVCQDAHLAIQDGKIVAATGEEHDSLHLRGILKQLPEYTEADTTYVMVDKAYNAKKICSAIKKTGRNPIMPPKHGYALKGFDAWSELLRYLEKHPRTHSFVGATVCRVHSAS